MQLFHIFFNQYLLYRVPYTNEDGEEVTEQIEHTETTLYVNAVLKTYLDMIEEYGFNANQIELIEQMMSPQNLAMLSGYGGGNSQSSLTQDEINSILSGVSGNQRTVCAFVLSKVGYPYSQAYRDSGTYYDCSSLAYYAWRSAGVDISHGGANTAAAEAQGLNEAEKTVTYENIFLQGDREKLPPMYGKQWMSICSEMFVRNSVWQRLWRDSYRSYSKSMWLR